MTAAPDYISPIIGCRLWQWEGRDYGHSMASHGDPTNRSKRDADFPRSGIGGATEQTFARLMLRILSAPAEFMPARVLSAYAGLTT